MTWLWHRKRNSRKAISNGNRCYWGCYTTLASPLSEETRGTTQWAVTDNIGEKVMTVNACPCLLVWFRNCQEMVQHQRIQSGNSLATSSIPTVGNFSIAAFSMIWLLWASLMLLRRPITFHSVSRKRFCRVGFPQCSCVLGDTGYRSWSNGHWGIRKIQSVQEPRVLFLTIRRTIDNYNIRAWLEMNQSAENKSISHGTSQKIARFCKIPCQPLFPRYIPTSANFRPMPGAKSIIMERPYSLLERGAGSRFEVDFIQRMGTQGLSLAAEWCCQWYGLPKT